MQNSQDGRFWRFLNGAVMVVVLATCFGVWFRTDPLTRTAEAQVPNAGLQRKQLVDSQQRMVELLEEIKAQLASGTLTVRIVDEKKKQEEK